MLFPHALLKISHSFRMESEMYRPAGRFVMKHKYSSSLVQGFLFFVFYFFKGSKQEDRPLFFFFSFVFFFFFLRFTGESWSCSPVHLQLTQFCFFSFLFLLLAEGELSRFWKASALTSKIFKRRFSSHGECECELIWQKLSNQVCRQVFGSCKRPRVQFKDSFDNPWPSEMFKTYIKTCQKKKTSAHNRSSLFRALNLFSLWKALTLLACKEKKTWNSLLLSNFSPMNGNYCSSLNFFFLPQGRNDVLIERPSCGATASLGRRHKKKKKDGQRVQLRLQMSRNAQNGNWTFVRLKKEQRGTLEAVVDEKLITRRLLFRVWASWFKFSHLITLIIKPSAVTDLS